MESYVRDYTTSNYERQSFLDSYSTLIRKVYLWMTLALTVTGLTSYYVATSPSMMYAIFSNSILFYGLMIAEVALVVILSARIEKLSFPVAAGMFTLYSVLNGVLMASIFVVFTMSSIASTFFVTAGMFCVMALIGTFTKTDLTKMGGILMMALIGVIIASLVNIFLGNSTLELIISVAGVIIFTGLTAWDAQKIKNMLATNGDTGEWGQKLAVLSALSLYLDFVNLFLYLLRFLGKRND